MVRKHFGHRSWLFLFLGLDLLKEVHELVGIVTSLVHVLNAQIIGLGLKTAGELKERHRYPDAGSLPCRKANSAAHKNQRQAGIVDELVARQLARSVAGSHVSDFMGHHAGKLSFVIGSQNQPGIYIEE